MSEFFDFFYNIITLFIVSVNNDTGDQFASDSSNRIKILDVIADIFRRYLMINVEFSSNSFFNLSENRFTELEIIIECIQSCLGFRKLVRFNIKWSGAIGMSWFDRFNLFHKLSDSILKLDFFLVHLARLHQLKFLPVVCSF
jgi:hypothetical protein